jgi:hypothetical protein
MMQPAGRNSPTLVGRKFKDYDFDFLKDKIHIENENKETRELARFMAPKTDRDTAVFFFKKLDQNRRPLITKDSKKLTLKIKRAKFDSRYNFMIDEMEFDVPKMLIGGELDL